MYFKNVKAYKYTYNLQSSTEKVQEKVQNKQTTHLFEFHMDRQTKKSLERFTMQLFIKKSSF